MNKITETFRGSRQFSNSCFPENTGFCFSLCFSYGVVHARKEYRLIRRNTTTAVPFSLAPRWLHTQVTHTLSQVGSHCDYLGANSGLLSRFPSQEGSRPLVTELSSAHPPAGRTEFAFPPAALACNSSASQANTVQELQVPEHSQQGLCTCIPCACDCTCKCMYPE